MACNGCTKNFGFFTKEVSGKHPIIIQYCNKETNTIRFKVGLPRVQLFLLFQVS